MIHGKLLSSKDDLNEVYNIIRKVFNEELNTPEILNLNQSDNESVYVLVYEEVLNLNNKEKIPVATGRIEYDGTLCRIDNIAVVKEFRRKKYGDFAVRMLINKAFICGINEVVLYSPPELINFFETMGFEVNGTIDNDSLCLMTINIKNIKTLCKK